MKHYVLWGLMVAAFFLLSSCGSSKKIQEKSPISTYIMPGADLISGNGILRGWGSGRSDSEASARKKALRRMAIAWGVVACMVAVLGLLGFLSGLEWQFYLTFLTDTNTGAMVIVLLPLLPRPLFAPLPVPPPQLLLQSARQSQQSLLSSLSESHSGFLPPAHIVPAYPADSHGNRQLCKHTPFQSDKG